MKQSTREFVASAEKALENKGLQSALARFKQGLSVNRVNAINRLPEFDALRDAARDIKDHTLGNLDYYLERYEAAVIKSGGQVHWASDAAEARTIILKICQDAGAKTVTKGKSMITEEIGLNEYLEENGIRPIETDLGEYIIQLRGEPPSHIIAPAVHLSKDQVAETFRDRHDMLPPDRDLTDPRSLLEEARTILRDDFIAADVGITGANMFIAETGSSIIVTNEGNGDLTQTLAPVHIVVGSIEKMVPTLEDATTILRVLARSATGQEQTVYTTFSTGPRRADDVDGPAAFHVVILDNGRSEMVGTPFHDMLRCIRCSACINSCPVYQAIGGHAYGWVYSGPMGAVLTPHLLGLEATAHLPNASTLCGRCEDVCPVRIPLPRLLRQLRARQFKEIRGGGLQSRLVLRLWALVTTRPTLYRLMTGLAARMLAWLAAGRGRIKALPLAGGWTKCRDLPAPEGKTFLQQHKAAIRKPGQNRRWGRIKK